MMTRDYRIASYCSSPSWGGLEMNVLRFLSWMRQRGWDAILYGRPETRMYAEAGQRGLPVRVIRSRLRYGDFMNAWRLARLLRRDNVQRLIVHQSRDMFLGVFAKKLSGRRVRLIYSQHMHVGGTKKDFYHSWLYNHLDTWATPVQWLADRVKEKTTIPAERIRVIPRGIDVDRFTGRQPDKRAARQKYNLPEDALIIGLVGRIDVKKCQDVAVEALAKVRAAGHGAHLLLVGDQSHNEGDEYVTHLRRRVDELDLGNFVHFHSHDDEVEQAYAALDVFVLASKSECYGMVTIEAMASGLPVIGTNDGGTVSIIRHGENGLLVTPGDPDELADALLKLIGDRDLAALLARQARDEAVMKYSHDRQCESWESLFEEPSA